MPHSTAFKVFALLGALLALNVSALPAEPSQPRQIAKIPTAMYLNGVMYKNGKVVAPEGRATAPSQIPCTGDDDVFQCATKIADSLRYNTSLSLGRSSVTNLNAELFDDHQGRWVPLSVDIDWDGDLTQCTLKPVVTFKEPGKACNIASCVRRVTYQETTTDTITQGKKLTVSAEIGATVYFVTNKITVTGELEESWSSTQTRQSTVQNDISLVKGEVCFPTTVQLQATCQSSVTNPTIWSRSPSYHTSDRVGILPRWLCVTGYYKGLRGAVFDKLCAAYNKANTTSVYVSVPGGKPWALEGCMRS